MLESIIAPVLVMLGLAALLWFRRPPQSGKEPGVAEESRPRRDQERKAG